MNFSLYEYNLTQLLKELIITWPHYRTGDMYRSIQFRITQEEGKLNIQLESKHYIVYLDDGTFLDYFFQQPQVDQIMEELSFDYIQTKLDLIQ